MPRLARRRWKGLQGNAFRRFAERLLASCKRALAAVKDCEIWHKVIRADKPPATEIRDGSGDGVAFAAAALVGMSKVLLAFRFCRPLTPSTLVARALESSKSAA
jgi:hypothetical protein